MIKNILAAYKKIVARSDERILVTFIMAVSAVLAAFCLFVVFAPVGDIPGAAGDAGSERKKDRIDMAKLADDYKKEASRALNEYAVLTSRTDFTSDGIEKIKNRLLALKVPAEFRDLHISLVMAMVKMENFLADGNNDDKLASEKTISDAKKNHVWLN